MIFGFKMTYAEMRKKAGLTTLRQRRETFCDNFASKWLKKNGSPAGPRKESLAEGPGRRRSTLRNSQGVIVWGTRHYFTCGGDWTENKGRSTANKTLATATIHCMFWFLLVLPLTWGREQKSVVFRDRLDNHLLEVCWPLVLTNTDVYMTFLLYTLTGTSFVPGLGSLPFFMSSE